MIRGIVSVVIGGLIVLAIIVVAALVLNTALSHSEAQKPSKPSGSTSAPSQSPRVPSRFLSISDFSLVDGQPTRVLLHVSEPQRLSIFINANRRIASCTLWHVGPQAAALSR